jgi:hypothetical protein
MKKLILAVAIVCLAGGSYAEEKESEMKNGKDERQETMMMHEQMAKAHQQAADCIKTGKPEEECWSNFRTMCKSAGGYERCGAGMYRKHMGK